MAELVILVDQNREGVVKALKMKSRLEGIGLDVKGMIAKKANGDSVPSSLVENITSLELLSESNLLA
ncbi:hypothetical protein BMS3Abin16_01175 [archaeon BMS3Abin16]|nr:hypothetical protein BMS3Abin16_01175 [archaeon BMS3Abin16]HDY74125.1 hypothetical protein [Euryarchaeota archaeon]